MLNCTRTEFISITFELLDNSMKPNSVAYKPEGHTGSYKANYIISMVRIHDLTFLCGRLNPC